MLRVIPLLALALLVGGCSFHSRAIKPGMTVAELDAEVASHKALNGKPFMSLFDRRVEPDGSEIRTYTFPVSGFMLAHSGMMRVAIREDVVTDVQLAR